MGPRPFGRGRGNGITAWDRLAPLQWGRDLSVAEGNGQPRENGSPHALQWGRDLSVAEGAMPAASTTTPYGASMGPRPFGRGRLMACKGICATMPLQWGRDLSVAEGFKSYRVEILAP